MNLQTLALLALLTNYFSFALSVFGVFRKPKERNYGDYYTLMALSLITWAATLYEIVTATGVSNLRWVLLIVLQLCALALFWWTSLYARKYKLTVAHSRDIPEVLITEGPYRFVRNPVYLAYLTAYFSLAIILAAPLSGAGALMMLACYHKAIRYEEFKFENSLLRTEYIAYKSRTGMFFPKLIRTSTRASKA